MSETQDNYVQEKISELRMRLLDLTNRNALLNFRHSERALTHVRIIDELPDFLFGSLVDGDRLTFKSLPEPDDEPYDERTDEFQLAFGETALTDEQYLEEIEELSNKDDCFDDLSVIERNLKNRVRESLGMPPVNDLKPLSNAQWAHQNDLSPKYDMPIPSEDDFKPGKHSDEYIQTLLKPKELQHKLSGLMRYINTDINETGVNTFYSAFGFLERYESNNSERPFFAPLVLLQLDPPIKKKIEGGEVLVSIQVSGEEPQYNLPLAEKLKEFGLQLPDFDGDDTPESYMQKIERLVRNQKGWRVRRFITFGRFQFARLVMYHDLNPNRWPEDKGIEKNKIINDLIAGSKEGAVNSVGENAVDYDIDTDPEVERVAPILIMDADSSQHSAIVDAMKGNNLVIKGPPGTGKSQTITNLIANALAKNKKVLFIAEKMAALNVVHSRLQSVGLDDYCLELHSTKVKLKDIKEGIARNIENRKSVSRPRDLTKSAAEIKEAKVRLREYSDVLNQPIGESGKTIHEIMWGEQNRRGLIKQFPVSIKKIRLNNALLYTNQELKGLCKELRQLEAFVVENEQYSHKGHPWAGVNITQASSLRVSEIIQAFEECADVLTNTLEKIKITEQEFSLETNKTISEWKLTYTACQKICSFKGRKINLGLLEHLRTNETLSLAGSLLKSLENYHHIFTKIEEHVINPYICIDSYDEVLELCEIADSFNLNAGTAESIEEKIKLTVSQILAWEKSYNSFENISQKIFGSSIHELKINDLGLLIKAIASLSNIDRELLFLRHNEEVINENSKLLIASALSQQNKLNTQIRDLENRFDLNYQIHESSLDEAIYELSTANIFSIFKPKYYKAWKTFKLVAINPVKMIPKKAASHLREYKAYKESKDNFDQEEGICRIAGTLFNGVETDFEGFKKINDWAIEVRKEFNGLDVHREKIRTFLLKADVSDIEAVKNEASDIHVSNILNNKSILHENQKYSEFIEDLKLSLEGKKRLFNFLKENHKNDGLTFSILYDFINGSLNEAKEIRDHVYERESSFREMLGDFYNGFETDRSTLKEAIVLNKYIRDLGLPDAIASPIYSADQFLFTENLSSFIHEINNGLCEVDKAIHAAQSVSDLDIFDYMGVETEQDAIPEELLNAIKYSLGNTEALNSKISYEALLASAASMPYSELLEKLEIEGLGYKKSSEIFEYLYYRTICDEVLSKNKILDMQASVSLDEIREKFKCLDRNLLKLYSLELIYKLSKSKPEDGRSHGRVSEYTEMGLIRYQALKEKARSIPIRSLISRAGRALQSLKPCFLMSPLSVAQYIDPHGIKFDMVIIDEASQMKPEDSLGAIARSGQVVVVGDPKQLPPTTFFNKQNYSDDDYDDEDKIDNESILDLSLGRFRPARDLLWHYRSRHESLIAFSNAHFYRNRLIVFPSPEERNDSFGIHYNHVGGTYNASCNSKEAEAIVEAAGKFMRHNPDKSLGIVTMNARQRELIDEAMDMLFFDDPVAEAYRHSWKIKKDGLEPFFVKNLESVQGDERDAIFISTVYGPDKSGHVMQRFGPINGKFGHRRLNVLFTRAKYNLSLFTSLRPDDIRVTESSALGLKAFKGYLEYAYAGKLDTGIITGREPDSDFEICVMEKLESIGCEVVPQVGVSGYFIDLVLRRTV